VLTHEEPEGKKLSSQHLYQKGHSLIMPPRADLIKPITMKCV